MSRRSDAPPPGLAWRRRLLLAGWLGAGAIILARAAQVQILQADAWQELAEDQQVARLEVAAPRGTILDRNGVPLALSRETFKISVAPREVRPEDRDSLVTILRDAMGIGRDRLRRVADPERSWVALPGTFGPGVRELVRPFRGVWVERQVKRELPYGELARGVLGRVLDGAGAGGIEQQYESLLRGRPGQEDKAKDSAGRAIPGQTVSILEPTTGGDVVLTLDVDLQEIAQKELAEAVELHEALAGDLVISNPHTGEILALASIRDGQADALSAINTPYEPGSTLKPFTVAAILAYDRGALTDSIDTGMGYWRINGRDLRDTHAIGRTTLADALRESSNIGIAKAALALTPEEQYQTLRDFGFGTPTGLPLPGESQGTLRKPDRWSALSPQSLAIGYEIGVTPLQMVMAYGALANGGRLMEPRIVGETRAADGTVVRQDPQVVRQVVDPSVTRALNEVLVQVVEDGTGTRAHLEAYRVAGKSGTARIAEAGRYSGRYFSTFVGYFPADDPQIVVYVKLDGARGAYYGGAVAAPVTRATMEAALASRVSPLDRGKLLRSVRGTGATLLQAEAPGSVLVDSRFVSGPAEATSVTVPPVTGEARVPDVRGLTPRAAIRRLHQNGFRVSYPDAGPIVGSEPAAGTRLQVGDTVRLTVRRIGS